jgi:hypothetical protein
LLDECVQKGSAPTITHGGLGVVATTVNSPNRLAAHGLVHYRRRRDNPHQRRW